MEKLRRFLNQPYFLPSQPALKDDIKYLRELLRDGKCCSVVLVQLGLELANQKNERLLQSVGGLYGGVQCKLLCAALIGAACMLNQLDMKNAGTHMAPQLAEWFIETFGAGCNATNCNDVLESDIRNRAERCLALLEATYEQAKETMEKHGYEFF